MTGNLAVDFDEVFAEEIEEQGELSAYEIEDVDGVTAFDESISYQDGWYIYSVITFRYKGKKYSIERKDHSSDNVSDSEFDYDSFHEVVASNVVDNEINKIIKGIEDETYTNINDIVKDLEGLKKTLNHLIEA